jgi:hypothetical protein
MKIMFYSNILESIKRRKGNGETDGGYAGPGTQQVLAELVNKTAIFTVSDLCERFNVSPATIGMICGIWRGAGSSSVLTEERYVRPRLLPS